MTTYPTVEVVRQPAGDSATKTYNVYDRNSDLNLGTIRWSFKCGQYTFFPNEGITLTVEVMEDIVHETKHANDLHRRTGLSGRVQAALDR